ncbi:tetratricopeptide (TPR) repeat protein [Granulicella aggregans]|uniref:Tetratricopeptide (TPR) repeat protein n=1 Tax=Granulicella aggregans TaxID=474949 RepID=A0A7W7ZHK1_9BACT|nr:M1 family aminopeptidase [Granulicella aggregans]MBB5059729.1 tetratricopeptide (TPR) repeat protein [Granulicella aggregans]
MIRICRSTLAHLSLCTLLLCAGVTFAAPVRPQVQATGYVINATVDPATNKLTATVAVTLTALEDVSQITLELNNGLQITKLVDAAQHQLTPERLTTNSTVRIPLTTPFAKGTSTTLTFDYSGTLTGSDTSPVEGIKLAAIADPVSILLYAGRWFPLATPGLFTNRFTAEMHIHVPSDYRVVGSTTTESSPKSIPGNLTEYNFNWTKLGFPGTLIIGKFLAPISAPGIPNVRIWVTEKHKAPASGYAETAAEQFEYFSSVFGQPESGRLNIVELPDDAVSAAWAPQIAAIAGNRIGDKNSRRLLANTIAHQWWGSEVSPATLNDAWITNGMSRYSELMYLEETAGKTSFQSAITDESAAALAYDTEPLTTLGRLDYFSPQFQNMTIEKGAMVFHMLRWEMGDEVFKKFLRGLLSQYTDKGIRSSNIETVAEAQLTPANGSAPNLQAFFAQWLDGTGAPQFHNKFTVYRLGNNKGFRTVGSIDQDLDLFRMPVALRIETDGKTELRRVDVSGSESQYTIETFGRPRRINIDPDNWLLKSTPDLAVRVAVLRGQNQAAQGDLMAALGEYQKALDINKTSSLANYRIGEIFFTQRNYQSSANSFRDALRGDGDPKWVEVWSHIQLGRIFDVTGQRDRAVNEYRLAVQTNDNTQGAVNEARALMQKPYQRPREEN